MAYTRPKFEVQGFTFQLKPTSPRNVQDLFDYLDDSDIEEEADEEPEGMILEPLAEQYLDVLFLIAEPVDESTTKGDLDPMDIDIKLVDSYMADFLPMSSATGTEQISS